MTGQFELREIKKTQDQNLISETELFSWQAPIRPVVKYSHDFWLSMVVISGVIAVIFYIIEGIMPVILIVALGFFYFIFSTAKPEMLKFSITNLGIKIENNTIEWNNLYRYWFSYWMGNNLLIFQTSQIGGRLELVINKEDKDKIRECLKEYLYEEKVPLSYIDKLAIWFSENMERRKKTSL
ncbi:MAG: hypothetical protein ABIK31_05760 [candidate division WOR-3 bacterium]